MKNVNVALGAMTILAREGVDSRLNLEEELLNPFKKEIRSTLEKLEADGLIEKCRAWDGQYNLGGYKLTDKGRKELASR